MLSLTRTHRLRISNRLAVLAAFLLIAATAASVGGNLTESQPDGPSVVNATAQDGADKAGTVRSVKTSKGFKVSLYLFRRN